MTPPDPAPAPSGWFDRARTVAPAGFDRWLVPPAALAIHLSIGQAYAFSVFDKPLHTLRGDPALDWSESAVGWLFSLAIVCLGLSAAVFGLWLERAGPRKAMTAAALCFGGGLLVAAIGVQLHLYWLTLLGYGVLGGVGLGLGYISPVSTLIKWFPDRPGLATGLAIMGFGGGAMVGSPLNRALLDAFQARGSATNGVAETFAVLGVGYALFMLFGALTVRVPPHTEPGSHQGDGQTPAEALRTRRFWLLWMVLFLNVTAGIGLLEKASSMIQDLFPDRVTAAAGAGFVGLLSLFNMAGRFGWSSLSDKIGRRATYAVFFAAGALVYALLPSAPGVALFVLGTGLLISMYGGGFAAIPAYLRDRFGTAYVGAIHGRLLTAWSAAGVAGPAVVNTLRESQAGRGVPSEQTYALPLYIYAGLLALGFVCNFLVGPPVATAGGAKSAAGSADAPAPAERDWATLAFRWAVVGVPLSWGVAQTVLKASALFR